ncbi:MAG: hypothetical protein C7B46_08230 [Sulfobacillus benefaciens]|uniref:Alpha/beta hydrolase n=1 Tax=Sulfobacillus benefaciens TaxID=453960 RepID=A0A2T2XH44_9FIRM|nr:MAG: hypothetical protein C7B46_08230 [Sulfobacillus benefaciens]
MVVMGAKDPDFPHPEAEVQLIADRLSGRAFIVPNAGHYPLAEYPEVVRPTVLTFLKESGLAALIQVQTKFSIRH